MSEERKLKVGDRVYRVSYYNNNEIKEVLTIDRVTKTQAISGNIKFKLEDTERHGLQTIPYQSGLKHWYYQLETEKLKQRFETQKLKKEIAGKLDTVNLLLGKLEHKEISLLEDINSKLSSILNKINNISKECKNEKV